MNILRQPLFREATTALLVALLLLQSATAVAPGPAWWVGDTQTVIDPSAVPDDFAVANAGQLKYMARQAMLAMDAELPTGAGPTIHALVDSWGTTEQTATKPDNGLAINQGQLKHVAAPFYDRLGLSYPWAGASAVTDNYALVNLGQLKHVFSFELKFRTLGGPSTAVTIPPAILQAALDAWNALPVKPVGSSADDFDGDGIPNLQEYLMSVADPVGHPMSQAMFDPDDIDGDRISNQDELDSGVLNRLDFADAVRDQEADGVVDYFDAAWNTHHHGDGVMNYEEVFLGLNLSASSTSTRTDGLSDAEVLVWTLNAGAPLEPTADPLRLFWEGIDVGWLGVNVGASYSSQFARWLEVADLNTNQIPDGLEAFRIEVLDGLLWWPQTPSMSEVEYPGLAYDPEWQRIDMDGDGALDSDRDYDGLPDLWEYRYELDPRDDRDRWDAPFNDPDGDGLDNRQEYFNGTNPRLADSDGDGFDDKIEVNDGGDPLDGMVGLPLTLVAVSSLYQTVEAGGASSPLAVKVTQGGVPVAGAEVEFTVDSGGGSLREGTFGGVGGTTLTLTSGPTGVVSAAYLAEVAAGGAGVSATLTGGSTLSFTLSILAASTGSTVAGGGGPDRPWADAGKQTSQTTGEPQPELVFHTSWVSVGGFSGRHWSGGDYFDIDWTTPASFEAMAVNPGRWYESGPVWEHNWELEEPWSEFSAALAAAQAGLADATLPPLDKYFIATPSGGLGWYMHLYLSSSAAFDGPLAYARSGLSTQWIDDNGILNGPTDPVYYVNERWGGINGERVQYRLHNENKVNYEVRRTFLKVTQSYTMTGSGGIPEFVWRSAMPTSTEQATLTDYAIDSVEPVEFVIPANGTQSTSGQGTTAGVLDMTLAPVVDKCSWITLLPVEVMQQKENADGTFGPFVQVSEIRPTRWLNAFDQNSQFKNLFTDPDRVKISVAGLNPSDVKIGVESISGTSSGETSDDDDSILFPAGDIQEVNLVADTVDDDSIAGVLEDAQFDRTHLSSFGAKVRLVFSAPSSPDVILKMPVAKPDGAVKVAIKVLNDGTFPNVDQQWVKTDVDVMHEIYTQIRVDVTQAGPANPVTPPNDVKALYSDGVLSQNDSVNGDELKKLCQWLPSTSGATEIPVYYIPATIKIWGEEPDPANPGQQIPVLRVATGIHLNDLRLKGLILISIDDRNQAVLAHEVGHALGIANHSVPGVRTPHLVMTDNGTMFDKKLTDSKRFTAIEEKTIKGGKRFYVPNP